MPFSMRATSRPFSTSAAAIEAPMTPAPITITSNDVFISAPPRLNLVLDGADIHQLLEYFVFGETAVAQDLFGEIRKHWRADSTNQRHVRQDSLAEQLAIACRVDHV